MLSSLKLVALVAQEDLAGRVEMHTASVLVDTACERFCRLLETTFPGDRAVEPTGLVLERIANEGAAVEIFVGRVLPVTEPSESIADVCDAAQ